MKDSSKENLNTISKIINVDKIDQNVAKISKCQEGVRKPVEY